MKENIEPLDRVEVVGKGGRNEPFAVINQAGRYLFISVNQLDRLISINGAYKEMCRTGIEPLENLKVVGRGGIEGHRPFTLPGRKERYLCVAVDHIEQLIEVNDAYKELLEAKKKRDEEERKRKEAEEKIKLEEERERLEREKTKEVIRAVREKIEEAEKAGGLKHVPEIMKKIEESFTELRESFSSAEYQRCIKLAPGIEEFVAEALKGIEEGKRAEELEKKKAEELGRYVYCIIPSPDKKSFGNIGMEGREVYTLPVGNMAAVVSDLPVKDYKEELESNAVVHDQVVKRIMTEHTVVPLALGQAFKNEDILKTVLKRAKEDVEKAFKAIEGKVEFGIKVFLPENQALDEDTFSQDVKELRKVADSIKLGKRFDKRMVLNAFYLVKEEGRDDFLQAVESLQKKYDQLNIQSTGPWPPYNFVEIKIGRG